MDVPDCRAILARDSARGCSPPFVASCMALKRSGAGSRPSRSRGPSQRPKQKFVEQYKTMTRRRNSEPANLKRMQEGTQDREDGLTLGSGKPNAQSRDQNNQSQERRVLVQKRQDPMSDDDSKNPDQQTASSSKEYRPRQHSSGTSRNPDKTTSRSTKAYQPRDHSASSPKIATNSVSGTPKRSRQQKPQEDSHRAKKTNVSVAEPKDDDFEAPD